MHNNRATRFDVSPDGRTLASISDDKSMIWWNLATQRPVGMFDFTEGPSFVAFSPTGEYLALGIDDRLRLFPPHGFLKKRVTIGFVCLSSR